MQIPYFSCIIIICKIRELYLSRLIATVSPMEQHIVMLFKGYNIFGNIKAYRLLSIDIGQENTKSSGQIK